MGDFCTVKKRIPQTPTGNEEIEMMLMNPFCVSDCVLSM